MKKKYVFHPTSIYLAYTFKKRYTTKNKTNLQISPEIFIMNNMSQKMCQPPKINGQS